MAEGKAQVKAGGPSSRRRRRIVGFLRVVSLGIGAAFIAITFLRGGLFSAGPLRAALFVAGVALGAVGLFVGARTEQFLLAFLATVLACLACLPFATNKGYLLRRLDYLTHRGAEIGIWQDDTVLGWKHVPDAVGTQRKFEFSVTYTIDATGCRTTPSPAAPAGEVLILGGSYAFGEGVNDDEVFSAVLARKHWRHVKVRNRGVMGYGTGQSYLVLREELQRSLPRAVIYAWTNHHVRRNYLQKGWLESLALSNHRNPYFEIENGRLAWKGLAGPEMGLAESKGLRLQEARITLRLIREMQQLCGQSGVPFFVVWLGADSDVHACHVMYAAMSDDRIRVVDATDVSFDYYRIDGHPRPGWHEAIADFLAASEIAKALGTPARAATSTAGTSLPAPSGRR